MAIIQLYSFLFCSIIAITASCKNPTTQASNHPTDTINHMAVNADTVNHLGNNLMLVYQDTKNNYWFGSQDSGVYRYDGNIILHFTTKSGLPANRIDEIKEDGSGNIYLNTTQGICKYNGRYFTTLTEKNGTEADWKLHAGYVWFKSSQYSGYVFRCDGENLYKLKLPPNPLGEDYILKNPNYPNPYGVYCVYKDSKGNIWFGTAVLGVCCFNGTRAYWISEPDLTELHNGPSNGVRSIAEDKDGYFWFNTDYKYQVDNSTLLADPDKKIIYQRIKSIGSLDGKPGGDLNEYLSIIKDNHQSLWIATYRNGVWKYDGIQLTHYPVQLNGKDITVFSIYQDHQGELWLGTHENGAFILKGEKFEPFVPRTKTHR